MPNIFFQSEEGDGDWWLPIHNFGAFNPIQLILQSLIQSYPNYLDWIEVVTEFWVLLHHTSHAMIKDTYFVYGTDSHVITNYYQVCIPLNTQLIISQRFHQDSITNYFKDIWKTKALMLSHCSTRTGYINKMQNCKYPQTWMDLGVTLNWIILGCSSTTIYTSTNMETYPMPYKGHLSIKEHVHVWMHVPISKWW